VDAGGLVSHLDLDLTGLAASLRQVVNGSQSFFLPAVFFLYLALSRNQKAWLVAGVSNLCWYSRTSSQAGPKNTVSDNSFGLFVNVSHESA
jgi:hypothetical protein